MAEPADAEITRVIQAATRGEPGATDRLLPLLYEDLRRLAGQRLRGERRGHSLNATELVHEAYLRLLGRDGGDWHSRAHFFGAAAEAMRRILIDRARRRLAEKRGGGVEPVDLDPELLPSCEESAGLLALHEALTRLEAIDPDKAMLVKLRHFAGLSEAQAAEALDISRATASRQWTYARAWLYDEIERIRGVGS
ncbi:MAG: sigma-70 family RNA polymerase sigma factor [Phycisphaerales bacterium]|nr:sigma-70 family RNA polymerase sigma factor [Phycisphaerales bacterium]